MFKIKKRTQKKIKRSGPYRKKYKSVSKKSSTYKSKAKYSNSPGVASGFINPPRRHKMAPLAKKGYKPSHSLVIESSGSIAPVYAGHLVHGTHPIRICLQLFLESLIRKVTSELKIQIVSFADQIGTTGNVNYSYYASPQTVTLTPIGPLNYIATDSWETLINVLITSFDITMLSTGNRDIKFELFEFFYRGTSDYASVNLKDYTCNVYSKSSFKIQNRSRNALGTEADEVDNVPINGKSYDLDGSGSVFRDFQRIAIPNPIINTTTGLHAIVGDTDTTQFLREVIPRADLKNCKAAGKVLIQPGEIKTSVLTVSAKFKADKLAKQYQNQLATTYCRTSMGSSRLFSLEKVIATNDVGEAAMSIFYELNNSYTVSYKMTLPFRPVRRLLRYSAAV